MDKEYRKAYRLLVLAALLTPIVIAHGKAIRCLIWIVNVGLPASLIIVVAWYLISIFEVNAVQSSQQYESPATFRT